MATASGAIALTPLAMIGVVCYGEHHVTPGRSLKNAALSAMDFREAAEILLRFYIELASRGPR